METELKPTKFINSGGQTEITDRIKELASALPEYKENSEIEFIFAVLKAIHQQIKADHSSELKADLFRKRTAAQILESGFATGCTDFALIAAAVFRAKNIPAAYVETFRRRWLESNDDFIEGHVFLELFLKNNWLIIDPENSAIKAWYDRYVVYKRGLDSWDIGIKDMDDMKRIAFDLRISYKK